MTYALVFLAGLILAPLIAQLRGGAPASLFFAAAAVHLAGGVFSFVQMEEVLRQVPEAAPAIHDTYYIVHTHRYTMMIGAVLAVIGAIIWAQTRFGAMRYPAVTKALFWLLHGGTAVSTAFQSPLAALLPVPRQFTDITTWETVGASRLAASLLASLALLGLLALLLWSVVRTLWSKATRP